MKPVFCFIDDTQFELDNFAQNAAPAFERVTFVYAHGFSEARARLAGQTPLCFLLDLYGADPHLERPSILELPQLRQALGREEPLEDLYRDLPAEPGAAGNLYLRRLYAQVERWQRAFLRATASLGQGRAFGLHNLGEVRRNYPLAAALAYSRKAQYLDAMALCQAGAEGILQKPQGADDQAIAQATRQEAPALARAAYAMVDRRLARLSGGLLARLVLRGGQDPLSGPLATALVCLASGEGRGEAAERLAQAAPLAQGLTPQEQELLRALSSWLASA